MRLSTFVFPSRRSLFAGLLLFGFSWQVSAADIVVPAAAAKVQGDTGNLFPILSPQPIRYQQVIDHTAFANYAAGGEYITQLAFRVHSPGIPFTASISSLQVNLSTTTKAEDALSPTFAANVGADETVVFPGRVGAIFDLRRRPG